jgi:hypothetical protein
MGLFNIKLKRIFLGLYLHDPNNNNKTIIFNLLQVDNNICITENREITLQL